LRCPRSLFRRQPPRGGWGVRVFFEPAAARTFLMEWARCTLGNSGAPASLFGFLLHPALAHRSAEANLATVRGNPAADVRRLPAAGPRRHFAPGGCQRRAALP